MLRRALVTVAAVVLVGTTLAGCGGDDISGTVGLYDRAPVPAVPDRTSPIDPSLATAGADGQYWAQLTGWSAGDPQPMLIFRLSQAVFAETCFAELGDDACPDGFGVIEQPSKLVDVPVEQLAEVTVVTPQQQNYAITGAELFTLAGGGAPSLEAAEGFELGEFPFLLTVRGGDVIAANQIWVP